MSQPLRDLAKKASALTSVAQEAQEAEEVKIIPLPSGFKPANEPDTVLQKAVPLKNLAATFSPAMGLNFEGLGSGFPHYQINLAPPDTEGAIGLTQYVQWVNTFFAVFNKTTGQVALGPMAGNTLWAGFGGGCETQNDGDPIVTYDKLADRWVFSQLVVRNGPFLQCVAVSTTSDATGTYNRYSFEYPNFDDYPKMGVWPDAYYETFNMFVGGVTFAGADACAYDRNAMLNGQPATQVCFQQASTVGSLLPADLDGHITPPAGSPNYLLEFDVNSLNLYKFHVDFVTPGNSTFTGPVNIPVAPFTPFCPSVRGCVPQPGGDGTKLDSLGDRLMYRLAYRNFGDHESLVVNHAVVADPVNQNSGIRWYEIQNPNAATPPVVAQQSTFAPDSGFRWMGSVAMDASGNMAVGYSVTNATLFPSIAFAARGAFDPPSTLQAETMLVTGAGAQTNGLTRWGDYSAMQVDPVDDCTFWYTTEYLQNSGEFNWNTRIANFKFPGCGATALSITKSHIGNFTQGQTGATYTISVTNIGSKPTDGTAVTVTDTLPAGLTATAISSADATWVCTLATLSCTRSDVLAASHSYAAITVNVNVAANAPGLVTNTATVSGGGSKDRTDNTANDVTTIIVTGPDPAIAKTHVPLVQGQTATYAITVTNRGLTATDPAQPVTVTDTLPAGITALSAGGTGWGTCTVGSTITCTRSDSLASNQSYLPITVSVSVGANALTTVVNTASVVGGGDVNPLNNTATDPAIVLATPPGLAITSPALPAVPSVAAEFKPGAMIAITGTATGSSFQDFRLQWAQGINPATGWSSMGITLAGGNTPVTNGPLGTWDTSGITQADYYSLRLTVDDAGFANSIVTFVYLEPSLISQHWPVGLGAAPEFYSGFQSLPDGSGNQRLFLVTPATIFGLLGQYLTFSPDGSSQTSTNLVSPGQCNPAVGKLDGFPGGDAVVPSRMATNYEAQVQLFHSDTSSAVISLPPGLDPVTFNTFTFDFQVPVLEDMEGGGQLDFVSLAAFLAGLNGTDHAFLLALRPNGSLLSGNFPVVIPDQNPNLAFTFKPRVLVGDLRGNGSKEFVVIAGTSVSTFTLLQFAHDGTPVPWAVPQFSGTPAAMVLADLDHNGMLETILTVAKATPSGEDDLTMYVFQPDGSERPGWPVDLGQVNPDDFAFSQMMVGDLNRDGTEEIIEAHINGTLNVLEPNGTAFPGFSQPALSGNLAGSLALADIDGDGFPEIIVSEYQIPIFTGSLAPNSADAPSADGAMTVHITRTPQGLIANAVSTTTSEAQQGTRYLASPLQAIRRDGTVARTWTLQGMNGNQPGGIAPGITVGDFNNDGFTDIALSYFTTVGPFPGFLSSGAAVVLTTGTTFNAAVNDWPMVFQNPRNTAVLRRPLPLATNTVVVLSSGTNPSIYGQPLTFTATVTPQSVLGTPTGKVTFYDGNTLLGIGSLNSGQAAFTTSAPLTGSNSITAVYGGDASFAVSTSSALNQTVNQASSSTAIILTSGTNPSTYGQQLSFTVTMSPQFSGTPTGSVTLYDGNTPLASATLKVGQTIISVVFSAGTHSIKAVYGGDANFTGSTSPLLSQTVNPAPLAVTANNKTRLYGMPNPPLDGVIIGILNGDNITATYSTTATPSSALGDYPIVPVAAGVALSNYTVTLNNGILRVSDRLITIQVVTGNPRFEHPSLKVTVTGLTAIPTGTVTVTEDTTFSGSGPLISGSALFDISQLTLGKHMATVNYSGDGNYGAITSDPLVFYRSPKPY